jgi:peroxiredoxin (alkyl hydroperoxide reductase subunit C)
MVETEYEKIYIPLIGEDAPSFEAVTTQGPISFPEDYRGKWVILFSHPADFTPVCTTEFMTFASMQEEFRKMNTELIGLSIDSIFSHIAWLKRIEEKIEYKRMKSVKIGFPVIADLRKEVAKKYGMIQRKGSRTQTARATVVIDPIKNQGNDLLSGTKWKKHTGTQKAINCHAEERR